MHANPIAENVLGTIGTVCWTAQLVPQVWKSWREKSTQGLSPWLVCVARVHYYLQSYLTSSHRTVFCGGISAGFLGAYTILLDLNIPLILQPQLFGFLALVSWGQCQYYGLGRSWRTSAVMALSVMLLVGGFEVAVVFAVRPAYAAGSEVGVRGVQFLGIFSSVLISLALLPQYVEIWRYREVVGISLAFMVVDMLGGVFSDLSLAFKDQFDVIAGITYSLVVVLDGFVVLAALILNPRAKKRRQRESAPGFREQVAVTDAIVRSSTTAGTPVASPCSSVKIEGEIPMQLETKL
ncbi:PQ-loop-domain-containing protein [Mycena venus]|uniref:PQ-loop-domain-containing protein n=1 Tax=Mycena venus TaxID=2733690 RepID=A0A8H6XL64_9AGAR|nr:PQ-loop-domain-containing protein [Mycena venus]